MLAALSTIHLDRLKCLRFDHMSNSCGLCICVCPENALGVFSNKFGLDEQKCVSCAACIGVCPSEALFSDSFNVQSLLLELLSETGEQERIVLSCGTKMPCISAFSAFDLLTIAIRAQKKLDIDFSKCDECEINKTGVLKASIKKCMDMANSFLTDAKLSTSIAASAENEQKKGRREFFRASRDGIKTLTTAASEPQRVKARLPISMILLKNSIKQQRALFEGVQLQNALIGSKQIELQSCTNCRDCVTFCPTNALFYNQEFDEIHFCTGSCIRCGICEDICKSGSIKESNEEVSLLDYAFDSEQLLVKHNFINCSECNTAFSYKGGSAVCPRCAEFKNDFASMFVTAESL